MWPECGAVRGCPGVGPSIACASMHSCTIDMTYSRYRYGDEDRALLMTDICVAGCSPS